MISSKPRLVVPYGLKTLLEGVSRAVLKTNPSNITQFAAVYFQELILFREGNTPMDIKELIKQFHHIKVEKWSEGMTEEKKAECMKEPEKPTVISLEPARKEKSTDTKEDNVTGPLCSSKTTQFPSVHAELSEHVDEQETVCGPSKPPSPPSSPSPGPEFAYVPADPAQFAAQMLGKHSSVHSDQSDILMVDVATSVPILPQLSSEAAEEMVVSPPLVCSEEVFTMHIQSQTSTPVGIESEPSDIKAEPSTASSLPLQDEQEPPAYDQAPEVNFQADIEVTSTLHISSIYNDVPVTEGVKYVEQMPEQTVIPFTDQVACLKENKQSPPGSLELVEFTTASGMSAQSVSSAKVVVQLEEDENRVPSVHVEAEGTVVFSDSSWKDLQEVSAHLEMEVSAVISGNTGQESRESSAPPHMEVQSVPPQGPAKDVPSSTSVKPSSAPPSPDQQEGLTEPELKLGWEEAPEQGLMEPAIAASEAGQPPPYSNMWTLYCLADMNQQSRPSPPPAPGPFPQATLYVANAKDPQFLQPLPKVTSPTYVMMDDTKKTTAPPFILVGSNVQEVQEWKPLPGHAVVSQSDTLKRYAAVQVPIAVPADQKFQKHSPNPHSVSPPTSEHDVPRQQSPVFLSMAFPVEDVAKKSAGSGDKRSPFGSYGIAGEITVTTAQVRRAET